MDSRIQKVTPYQLAYCLVTKELRVLGFTDDENDIAVFIEYVKEFEKKDTSSSKEGEYHPYFEKVYNLSIARVHDFEPAEHDLLINFEGYGLSDWDLDFNVPKEVLKKIIYHAKMLADAIDELLNYVPLDKLPKEEDVYGE